MNITTKTELTAIAAIAFSALPKVGQPLEGGIFCGIVTAADGTHQAVVLLVDAGDVEMKWKEAGAWAESVGGQLPTRSVAALLYANARDHFKRDWYWTCQTYASGASYAWYCHFFNGGQGTSHESYEGRARAVRLIPIGN